MQALGCAGARHGPHARAGALWPAALVLFALLVSACARHSYSPRPLATDARPAAIAATRLDLPAHAERLRKLGQSEPLPDTTWTPAQLGVLAVGNSPALVAARAAVATARAATVVAGAPAPIGLEVETSYADALDPGENSRWTAGPRLTLRFSPKDKRRLRAGVAAADVLMAEAGVIEAAWVVRRRTLGAALRLAAARRERSDTQARIVLLNEAVSLAREQVDSGLSGASEWQLLQLEANSALMNRAETVTRIAAAGGELAAALSMPLAALHGLRVDVSAPLPPIPSRAEWQRAALTGHPQILEMLAAYDKRERELELAVAEQYPDIEFSPGYLFDQGDNVWSLLGGVVLPLPARQHALIARALAARDAAGAAFEAAQAELIGRIEVAYAQCQARRAALSEFRAVRDDATAMHHEAQQRPLLAAADALIVPRARLQLAAAESRLARAMLDARHALAELEYAAAWAVTDPLFARQLAGIVTPAATDSEDDDDD